MTSLSEQITVICANFKTPDLVLSCVTTFHEFYPDLPFILIDNGGCAKSVHTCLNLAKTFPNIRFIRNETNAFHGPTLHQGICLAETPYAFTLDSDVRTLKGKFLELMLAEFEKDTNLFAIGWLRYVGNNGVPTPHQENKHGHPYVHPYASLLDVAKYHTLRPFSKSGAPANYTMRDAIQQAYTLASFSIEDYVEHKVAGTRGRFAGVYNPSTDLLPKKWRPHRI